MRRLGRRISPLLILCASSLATAQARADEIDPAEDACGEVGDSCEVDGKQGTCVKATCSRLDYSSMKGDGEGPSVRNYDCAKCIPGATPQPDAATKTETATKTDTATKAEPKTETKADASRCTVGASTSMASFALGLLLLGLVARRKR